MFPLAMALLVGTEKRSCNFFLSEELRFASAVHLNFKSNWLADGFASVENIDGIISYIIAKLKKQI